MDIIVLSKNFRLLTIFFAGCLLLTACSELDSSDAGRSAEFVFTNGKIYTGDPSKPWVSSIAITDGGAQAPGIPGL